MLTFFIQINIISHAQDLILYRTSNSSGEGGGGGGSLKIEEN